MGWVGLGQKIGPMHVQGSKVRMNEHFWHSNTVEMTPCAREQLVHQLRWCGIIWRHLSWNERKRRGRQTRTCAQRTWSSRPWHMHIRARRLVVKTRHGRGSKMSTVRAETFAVWRVCELCRQWWRSGPLQRLCDAGKVKPTGKQFRPTAHDEDWLLLRQKTTERVSYKF